MDLLLKGIWESHARKDELVLLPGKVVRRLKLPIGKEVSKSLSLTVPKGSIDVQFSGEMTSEFILHPQGFCEGVPVSTIDFGHSSGCWCRYGSIIHVIH